MKLLHVNKGFRLSLQYHEKKVETSYVMKGKILLHIRPVEDVIRRPRDESMVSTIVNTGEHWHCPPMTLHRIEALEDTIIVECSTPEVKDVVRVKDDYGR